MDWKKTLLQKIADRRAVVGIVGLGYVGLPLVFRFLEVGFRVVGFDVDERKVEMLHRGEGYIAHLDVSGLPAQATAGNFRATSDFSLASQVDAVLLCVPTPLNRNREPDLSFVMQSTLAVLPHMTPGSLLSLESTTYPGTTEELLRPAVEKRGFRIGEDFFLVFSPEREDPGNKGFSTHTIPKVCGGTTPACLEVGCALYSGVIEKVVPVSSTAAAEMTKILENTYRAVNIALVNELKMVADRMGLDIFEVIKAAATKPFGFAPFFPGPGLGGHCIPIDPFYLTWKAREYDINTRFIELAGEVNTSMPDYVIHKVIHALNHHRKPVKGSRILLLGIAYKKNVDDMRESPSLLLMERLLGLGAEVDYADPHVPSLRATRAYDFRKQSVAVGEDVSSYDCVLVATDHDLFDWDLICRKARLIVDARGRFVADGNRIWRA
ncbi:MAG: nucleotide sugar dehydrogenase [Magnetococcales bacterium]|nr:nucleotide sugar dehydrogenase [Magnetococcales bacterium]